MKKITLFLFALLTMSLGYSQACTGFSNETGGGSATFTNGYNYSFSTVGGNVVISFEILDTFPGLVGQLELVSGTNPGFRNMTDSANTFSITLTDQVGGTPLTFAFFGPHAGGATVRTINFTYTVGDTCTPTPAEEDVTLSDLQIDGTTVAGFNAAITTYNIEVPGAGPIPQITTVTTTNAQATVGTITQASAKPGTATFDVTSEDTTVTQTYTINFIVNEPTVAAPTPLPRAASNVISIFSDAFTNIGTLDYDNTAGAIDTYNTEWCPINTELVTIVGNPTNKMVGSPCDGIDFQSFNFDLSSFTHFHIDIWTPSTTMDKSFNVKVVNFNGGGGEFSAIEYSFTNANFLTTPNQGTWYSFDVPLSSFSVANNNATVNDINQFVISTNLGTVFYDNLYFYKGLPLSTKDVNANSFRTYPNPTQDNWTIETQNIRISSITVYDVLGKRVMAMEVEADKAVIDGSSLKSGLYFAKVETEAGTSSVKLIKN